MRLVVPDASVLAAVAFGEPQADVIGPRLRGFELHAPTLLRYEMANIVRQKSRREPKIATKLIRVLADTLGPTSGITWHDVEADEVALLANATGLTAYDATYLWLAGWLGADLVTLDAQLSQAGLLLEI